MKQESLSQVAGRQGSRPMCDENNTFNRLRRRLERIAHRMLGSEAEAEDIVQDAWLRWNATAGTGIENEEAWLISVTTRLCVDRLREIRIRRAHCSTQWLASPQAVDLPATPQEIIEIADEVSMAYLLLLERLTRDARAAFLMHEVLDTDYGQIAAMLHKTPEACRKLVSRAKMQLQDGRAHFVVSRQAHSYLLRFFVQALGRGDSSGVSELLTEEAAMMEHAASRGSASS
jgi:RNA polymerase sigma-70 factor (ECF subfamily)